MRRLVLSLVVALGLGRVATAQSSPAPSMGASSAPSMAASPAPPTGASPAASPAPAANVVVHIKDFAYVPETVTIRVGQTVKFVEDDDTAHTVTASDASFDSGNMDKGAAWSHTFSKEGTYPFLCSYHPYMKGRIIVKAP